MKMTAPQQAYLNEVRTAFGKDRVTHKPPRTSDGVLRITAQGIGAVWEWSIGTHGEILYRCGTMRMFDVPVTKASHGRDDDIEISATQRPRKRDDRTS